MKPNKENRKRIVESIRNTTNKTKEELTKATIKLIENIEKGKSREILVYEFTKDIEYCLEEADGVYFLNRKLYSSLPGQEKESMDTRVVLTDEQVKSLGDMRSVPKLKKLVNELEAKSVWGI